MNANPSSPAEDWSDASRDAEPVLTHRTKRRLAWALLVVLVLLLLVVLPPLLNVGRFQRRVAQAISQSIGRPVHFDEIHLHLLPLPGITIQNFVVQEDPAFGTEPVLRANNVEARLRFASLWRRQVEVSRISLQAPSINLVRLPDGRWNVQGVVTQAGYLQSAPTTQQSTGQQPRFPYVEATDARINIKDGEDKLPWSLLDAKLALWLPEQTEWRVRLRGRPLRTDTDVSDVGELQLEGSLGRGNGGVTDQPLALSIRWASTPLGEAAKLVIGKDTGFRGAASAEMEVRGTPAQMHLSTDLHLHNLRRAEFVPRLPMSIDAHCEAQAMGIAHELHNVRCAIPTAQSGGLFEGVFRSRDEHVMEAPDVLAIRAEVPNVLEPKSATVTADLNKAKPEYFLNWLRIFSSRIAPELNIDGSVTAHAEYGGSATDSWALQAECQCALPSSKGLTALAMQRWRLEVSRDLNAVATDTSSLEEALKVQMLPINDAPIRDEGHESLMAISSAAAAASAISGSVTRTGYKVEFPNATLAGYAARLIPPLGDYMPAEYDSPKAPSGRVQSQRAWGQAPHWAAQTPIAIANTPGRKRRR